MAARLQARVPCPSSTRAVWPLLLVLGIVSLSGCVQQSDDGAAGVDAITWSVPEDPFHLHARTVVYVLPGTESAVTVFDHQRWSLASGNASDVDHGVFVQVPRHAEVVHLVDEERRPLSYVLDGTTVQTTLPANTTGLRLAARLDVETAGEVRIEHPWPADRSPPGSPLVPTRIVLVLPDGWTPTGPFIAAGDLGAGTDVVEGLQAEGFTIPFGPYGNVWVWEQETEGGRLVAPFTLEKASPAGDAPWAVLTVLVIILIAWTLWLFRKVHRTTDDPVKGKLKMGMMGHLDELRRRATVALLTLLVASAFFFTFGFRWIFIGVMPLPEALGGAFTLAFPLPVPSVFHNAAAQVFGWIAATMVPSGVDTIVTRPLDAAMTQIGLSIGLGVLVTFPVLFYQAYAFVAPGLYPKERKVVLQAVPFVIVLFVAGAMFGLMVMTPFMTRVLYAYAEPLGATAFANVVDLVSFAGVFTVMFGLAFQLPAVMGLLARVGIASAAGMARYWRHAVVAIAVVSAFVTDPTLLSQIIVGSVLFVLYLTGLGLAWVMERRYQDALPHSA